MSLFQSDWAEGRKQAPVSREANGVVVERFEYDVEEALALNDIIEIGVLPAYHYLVDAILIVDDLDSGGTPAITLDVGIMSGDAGDDDDSRTCGDEIFDGDDSAQAGGMSRMSNTAGFLLASSSDHRGIGVKVATAAATHQNGKITLVLQYAQ